MPRSKTKGDMYLGNNKFSVKKVNVNYRKSKK